LVVFAIGVAELFPVADQATMDLAVVGQLLLLRFLEVRVRGVDAAHIGHRLVVWHAGGATGYRRVAQVLAVV
jgi:hypothetical protein